MRETLKVVKRHLENVELDPWKRNGDDAVTSHYQRWRLENAQHWGRWEISILSAAGGSVHGRSVQICREFLSGYLSQSDYVCQKTRSQKLQRTAVLQCTLYIRIKGGDVRRYMESIGGRLRRQVGESKAGKSLGLDKRQNGETHFFSIGGYRIANN